MCGRDLRARWLLAACACAMAVRVGAEVAMQCSPFAGYRCKMINPRFFFIDYYDHLMFYTEGQSFSSTCRRRDLDSLMWPVFPEPAVFKMGYLTQCRPPQIYRSFAGALSNLNITITDEFSLIYLPNDTRYYPDSLAGMPPKLKLHSLNLLVLPAGVLGGLHQITDLTLDRVRVQELPPNLKFLWMKDTGVTKLLPDFLKNLSDGGTIAESKLVHFEQTIPKLRWLKMWTPQLKTFSLYDTPIGALQKEPLIGCGRLKYVELRSMRGSIIPPGMLNGTWYLWQFELTQSNISSIPVNLFSQTPRLRSIILSDNKLQELPRNLFMGLTELTDLRLTNNQLLEIDMVPTPAQPLVNENVVLNICPHEISSRIRCLTISYLNKNMSLVCPEWLQNTTSVRNIDLNGTDLRVLNSTVRRASPRLAVPASVELDSSLLDLYNCSKFFQNAGLQNTTSLPAPQCDCGTYWLTRMMTPEVDTRPGISYAHPCAVKWETCI